MSRSLARSALGTAAVIGLGSLLVLTPAPAHAAPDVVPPQVTVNVPPVDGDNGWHRNPIDVAVRATDRSGIDEVNSRVWLTGAETGEVAVVSGFADLQVTAQGHTTVHWEISDPEGNVATGSRTVARDSGAPIVSLEGGRPVVDLGEKVPVEPVCGEPVSGLASCRIEGNVERGQDGRWYLDTLVPQGIGATAIAVDNAGNESRVSRYFTVVTPPAPSTTALAVPARVSSRQAVRATLTLGQWGATGGVVVVKDGARELGRYTVPATVSLAPADWSASLTVALPRLRPGTHRLTADYLGNDQATPSTSRVVTVVSTSPAVVTTRYGVRAGRHLATVTVRGLDARAAGRVTVLDGTRRVGTGILRNGRVVVRLAKLGRGTHRLSARYAGSATVQAAVSRVTTLRVR